MTELKEKALDRLKAIFPNHCEYILSDIINTHESHGGCLTEDKLVVRCVNQILEGEQAAEKRLKASKQETAIAEAKKQEDHEQVADKSIINAKKIKSGKRKICERRITRSVTRKENSRKAGTKGLKKGRSKKTTPPARKGNKARFPTDYREEEQTVADGSPSTSASDKSSIADRDPHHEVSLSPKSSSSYGLSSMCLDSRVDSSKIGLKMGHGEGNTATLMKDWLAKCGPSKDGKEVKDGEDLTHKSSITGDEGETTQSSTDGRFTPTFSDRSNSRDGVLSDILCSEIPFSPVPSTADACSNSDLEIISLASTAGAKSRDSWSQDSQCEGHETQSIKCVATIDKSIGQSSECDSVAKKSDMDVEDVAEEAADGGAASSVAYPGPSHQSMNTTEDSSENDSVINISDSVDGLSDSVINIQDTPVRKDIGVIDISDIVELESPRRLPQLLDSGFGSSRKVSHSEDVPLDPLDLSVTDMDDTDTSNTEEDAGDGTHLKSVDRLQTSDSGNQMKREDVTDIPTAASSEIIKDESLTTSKQRGCFKETMNLTDQVLVSDNMKMEQAVQQGIAKKPNQVAECSKTRGKSSSCVIVESESESEFYISSSESDDLEDSSEQMASASTSASVSASTPTSVSTSVSTSTSASLGQDPRLKVAVQIAQVSSSSPDVVFLGKREALPPQVLPVQSSQAATTCDTVNYKELKHRYQRMKNIKRQFELLPEKTKADPVYCKRIHETCEQLKREIRKQKHARRKKVEKYIKSLKVHKIDIVDGSTLRVTNTRTDKSADRGSVPASHPTEAHQVNNSQSSSALSFMKIIGEARKLLTGKDSTESRRVRQSSQKSLLQPDLSLNTTVTTCTTLVSRLLNTLIPQNVWNPSLPNVASATTGPKVATGTTGPKGLTSTTGPKILVGSDALGSTSPSLGIPPAVLANLTKAPANVSKPPSVSHVQLITVPTATTATTTTAATPPTSTAKSKELDAELQQVISIFPDVEVKWAMAKLKSLSAKHPDDFLPRICSTMADDGYQRNQGQSKDKPKGKGKGKHKSVNVRGTLGKIKSSQRYADVLSEIGEEEKVRLQRKRQSEELMETEVPPKLKIMTDGIATETVSKGDNKDDVEARETNQSDTVFRLQCESCSMLSTTTDLSQCREGHLLCRACIEKQVKVVLSQEIETIIICPLKDCNSEIRLADAKKVLPQFVVDLLREKIEKQERLCISKMGKVVSCPDCGLSVMMDAWDKQFHCPNTDCMLASCRYCKRAWNDGRHDNCTPLLCVPSLDDCTKYPSYWDPCTMGPNEDYLRKIVPHDSMEFNLIKAKFLKTMQNYTIVYLTRIQNPKLWQKYGLTRSHILEDFGPPKLNENHLFHGTDPSAIDAICKEGFDWRLCGAHGTAFGQGSYFAVEAHYSHSYVQNIMHGAHYHHNRRNAPFFHGHYLLLIARVVCGRYTLGNTTMRRPPVDPSDTKRRPFNSTVNSMTHPGIYVTFDSAQSYPEYVLEYKS